MQLIQHLWQAQINGPDELTPVSRFNRMVEEVDEAREALDGMNSSQTAEARFAGEVADIIFVALGVLSVMGVDAEAELNKIMRRNAVKYNVVVNGQLREQGMSAQEAMVHQKKAYKP